MTKGMNRLLKDRQEILVVGELVLFLVAWVLGIAAAVDDYRVRTNAKAGNSVAASSNATDSNATNWHVGGGGGSALPYRDGVDPYGIDPYGIDGLGHFE